MKMTDISPADNSWQICPQCNTPVAPDRKFCESCGAKIEIPLLCSQCGAPGSKGRKFCESCGAALVQITEVKSPVVPLVLPEQVPSSGNIEEPVKLPQHSPVSKLPGTKKPLPTRTFAIIGIILLIVVALGAYAVVLPLLFGAGTSEKSGGSTPGSITPVSGSAMGTAPSEGPPPVTGTLTPGPTQVPPPNLQVNFQAERDPITSIVTVTFTGGSGLNGVRDVVCRLTRSDGQVISQTFTLQQVGSSASLQGTKMTDRIQVTARYYNGDQYTVLDQVFEYKKR